MAAPFPASSNAAIHAAIQTFPTHLFKSSDPFNRGLPLAIKYLPADCAKYYLAPGGMLRVSDTVGFTWGTGTYVAPLAYPVSSAIFGRIGVVARFDPSTWQVFDATNPVNQNHYLWWAWQQPMYARQSALTAGSAYYNHLLRDRFREQFQIDCVLFPPDQANSAYTRPGDVWMCVTEWVHGKTTRPPSGTRPHWYSTQFVHPRFTVLVDEEFADDRSGTVRTAHLGFRRSPPANDKTAKRIAKEYLTGTSVVRIKA